MIFTAIAIILLGVLEVYSYAGTTEYLLAYYSSIYISYLLVWYFVGKELNHMKEGVIAGVLTSTVCVVIDFLSSGIVLFHFSFIIASFSGVLYFVLQIFKQNKTRSQFIWVAGIGMVTLFHFIHGRGIRDFWNSINESVQLPGVQGFLKDGILLARIDRGLGGLYPIQLDYLFGLFAGLVSTFLVITFFGKLNNAKLHWKDVKIDLRTQRSKKDLLIFLPVFYLGITFLCFNVFSTGDFWLHIISGEYTYSNPNFGGSQIGEVFRHLGFALDLMLSIFWIILLSWFYRKILTEYYLQNYWGMSWNYYLGQIPVIGLIVWLINFSSNRPSKIPTQEELKNKLSKGDGLKGVLIALLAVFYLFTGSATHQPPVYFIVGIATIGFYALYLFARVGIFINIGLQLLLFLMFIAGSIIGFKGVELFFTIGFFWSIAQYVFLYPAFHARHFTFDLPKSNENDELQIDKSF